MTEMITAAAVFEELRFVWELWAAEMVLLFPFARVKGRPALRITASAVLLGVCAQAYFFVLHIGTGRPSVIHRTGILTWYLLLVLLSLVLVRYCFSLTLADGLFFVITGYSAQHIVYVTVHEVLAKGLMPWLPEHLWLYVLLSVLAGGIYYSIIYFSFSRQLILCGGVISEEKGQGMLRQLAMLVILMASTFTCQHIFEMSREMRYNAAFLDILLCSLILASQFHVCRVSLETKEKAILTQMREDSARFYAFSRELIETVNRKSHDMKHVLNALEHGDESQKKRFIDETRKEIEAYRQLVRTDYEDLNTILAEKTIYCENRNITLSCVVTEMPENVLSALDLYVLLGNAIDNAVECVSALSDEKKRVITVNAGSRGAFLSIRIDNYYEGILKMKDGFPVTTKRGKYYHGFGLKSIRSIALKYGGDISIETENGIFSLQIMIPVRG